MKTYLAIFRIRFINSLQYREAALAGMATQFAWGFMEILAFAAFYKTNPAAFPMEFSHTVSYIWMQQAFLALFVVWFFEAEVFDSISSGGIAYQLARPVDLYKRWFTQTIANRVAKVALRCLPILLIAVLVPAPYRLSLPPNASQFFMFLVSTLLGLGVVVAFSMLIYITTFYTLSSAGVRIIAAALSDFMAGSIIPLPFFPQPFRAIAEVLPFAAMQNMPLRIYSGNIAGNAALWGMGLQVFWLVILILIGRVIMNKALGKVVVQGG